MIPMPPLTRPAERIQIHSDKNWLLIALAAMLLFASFSLEAKGLGYAFSGGGARGFAQIGILKVLEEEGIYPDYICGTSMGALVGALYSMGYSTTEIEELLLALDISDLLQDRYARKDLYIGQKRWPQYGNLTLDMGKDWIPRLPSSMYVANRLNLTLARLAFPASPYRSFSLLPIPFSCVATNLVTGEAVTFDQGSLMQAIRASISIPSMMMPFEFEARTYIDGGISQNLPLPQVCEMGADVLIGFKTNTNLRGADELVDVFEIIDQTINIGMTRNIMHNLDDCDLLMEPDLEEFITTGFSDAQRIVVAGEQYARERLPEIRALRDSLMEAGHLFTKPQKVEPLAEILILDIETQGNEFISGAKIREYLGLETGQIYSPEQIMDACFAAWNSQAFETIYPVLVPAGEGYHLLVYVHERERRNLALNVSYTSEEELNVGAVLSLNNLLMKNSKFLAGFTLGGRTELNLDFVKNFGEFWGAYFRIYPWLSENRLYIYDAEHHKTDSVKALEFGVVPGIGVFAEKIAVAEAFTYSYRTKLYRDISDTAPIDSLYLISGMGVKTYHESLDDDVFPRSGVRAFAKANFARWEKVSDQIYSRFVSDLDVYTPFLDFASLRLGFDYGTYFGDQAGSSADPFYFCGSNGYRGYQRYEVSSSQYKIHTLGLVFNPLKNLFLETGVQGLNIAGDSSWDLVGDTEWALYADLGYRTLIGPVKLIAAARKEGRPNLYLNIGFDTDIFWLSRK